MKDKGEIAKGRSHTIVSSISYKSNCIVSKTVLSKLTRSIIIYSFDKGTWINGNFSQYNTYIQLIEGQAELSINSKKHNINSGYAD